MPGVAIRPVAMCGSLPPCVPAGEEEAEETAPQRGRTGETGEDSAGPDGEAGNQGEDLQLDARVEDRGSARPDQNGGPSQSSDGRETEVSIWLFRFQHSNSPQ